MKNPQTRCSKGVQAMQLPLFHELPFCLKLPDEKSSEWLMLNLMVKHQELTHDTWRKQEPDTSILFAVHKLRQDGWEVLERKVGRQGYAVSAYSFSKRERQIALRFLREGHEYGL